MPVQRHSAASLAALLGDRFELCATEHELHITPRGAEQAFVYALFAFRA